MAISHSCSSWQAFWARAKLMFIVATMRGTQCIDLAEDVRYPISLQFQSRPPLKTIAFIPLLSRVRLAWGKRLAMA
jgi:hypothetical protein